MIVVHSRTPVALFAYRRADHLARTLDSLIACASFTDREILIFSDGPRTVQAEPDVRAVRDLIDSLRTPNMQVIKREQNLGLANSIIWAVTQLTDDYGSVIVIEDDLILHPATLLWFDKSLATYGREEKVMQIGAYQYRIPEFARQNHGTIQRFITSWGWATWKRAWDYFDPSATGWGAIKTDMALRRDFDLAGSYPYSEMLEKQMEGRIDSWAIRWWWSVFRAGGVSVMPPRSLVKNIGFDASATHNSIGFAKRFLSGPQPLQWEGAGPPGLPSGLQIDTDDELAFRRGLLRTNALRNSRIKRALSRVGFQRFG